MKRMLTLYRPEQYAIQAIDGYEVLREAICTQAANDLRGMLSGRKMPYPCSYSELRSFFLGEWGSMLFGNLDGEMVFNRIVKEHEGNGNHERLRSGQKGAAKKEPDPGTVRRRSPKNS